MKKDLQRRLTLLLVVLTLVGLFTTGVMAEESSDINEVDKLEHISTDTATNKVDHLLVNQEELINKNILDEQSETAVIQTNEKTDNTEIEISEDEIIETEDITSENGFNYAEVSGGVSIKKYSGSDTDIIIPSTLGGKPVVAIGRSAFFGNNVVTNISIPEGVTTIGQQAFYNCQKLRDVSMPTTIQSIDAQAFFACTNLEAIQLNEGLENIGYGAFYQCKTLKSVVIPNSVIKMDSLFWGAFQGCTSLEKVKVGSGLKKLNNLAFAVCTNLKSIELGENIETIGNQAFYLCNNITIYGVKGSYSQKYAVENSIPFIEITIEETPLVINNFITDKLSGQSINSVITLSASGAGGTMPYQYKYFYKLGGVETTIKEYSVDSSAVFNPTQAGSYTLWVEIKDAEGNTATKSIENFVINEESRDSVICKYRTHVQNEGWQNYKSNGAVSGTSGKSYRLEGIEISLENQGYDLGVEYKTHVQNEGWQEFKSNGAMSGTSGKSLRLEAIQIKLTGDDAEKFDIYYQVHAQNFGWLGWAKNGENAGTAGYGYRLEAIKIRILPSGSEAPGETDNTFIQRSVTEQALDKMCGTWVLKFGSDQEVYKITKKSPTIGHIYNSTTLGYGDATEYDFSINSVNDDGSTTLYIDKNSIKKYGMYPTYETIAMNTLMNDPNSLLISNVKFNRE